MAQKKKTKKKNRAGKADRIRRLVRTVIITFCLAILMVVLIGVSRNLYRFGYDVFGEKPGTGVEIEIEFEVAEGESAMTTARRLKTQDLISSEAVFLVQKILYDKEIIAGTHVLNSNMTTLEVLDELSVPTENADDY